ncbi:alpha-amylase, partial [bacterium]|nr:alpha-amylase [bacterium]
KKIKQLTGNPEAEASAYSLNSYEIASTIGGGISLDNLRDRCAARGIRLASDMVPNHTGVDSNWIINKPDLFLQMETPSFPSYTYNSEDLSRNPDVGIFLEDHYYNQTDAAVSFKRTDKRTGKSVYIYHGNDGTSMPWNDTAQLNFLNPETRETIIKEIIQVAKQFPIIRFDEAMTLAKKHIQRLWYPKPGTGGDIPGRALYGMDQPDFDKAIPVEFWREVVDRIAAEVPDTLLLAEAFWMMEGYFVRTLGMHRVYNSAFMNMLKLEENCKYRDTIKNTIAFDPEVLKRFVNFMNNPDEDTAIEQFGDGDKYLGVCTLLVTMPGLPMIGHGQIEGFREKYGMEFSRSYRDESPDQRLMNSHYKRIFPLMHKRDLFSESDNFALYDVQGEQGVQESIFAYTNGLRQERALVLYNNSYQSVGGWMMESAPFLKRFPGDERRTITTTLAESLLLTNTTDYYCILKEFNNGLYFIQSSAEIHKRGLHIILKGYESQVFLDIKEIKDIDGIYYRLCEHLNGRGIEDIELEVKRTRLQAIHTAAKPLVSEHTFSLITAVLNGSKSSAELLLADLMKISIAIGTAWVNTHFSGNSSLSHSVYRPTEAVFSKAVDILLTISESVNSSDTPLCRYISNSLSLMPEIPAVLAGWLLCLPIHRENPSQDTRNYSTELLLNEFLHDRLHECGIVSQDIMRVTAAIDSIFENYGWFTKMMDEKKSNNEQLAQFLTAHSFRLFIKANWYEGVEWYHKESFQESLFWLVFSELSWSTDLVSGRDQKLYQTIISWLKKESGAAYRVSALLLD